MTVTARRSSGLGSSFTCCACLIWQPGMAVIDHVCFLFSVFFLTIIPVKVLAILNKRHSRIQLHLPCLSDLATKRPSLVWPLKICVLYFLFYVWKLKFKWKFLAISIKMKRHSRTQLHLLRLSADLATERPSSGWPCLFSVFWLQIQNLKLYSETNPPLCAV